MQDKLMKKEELPTTVFFTMCKDPLMDSQILRPSAQLWKLDLDKLNKGIIEVNEKKNLYGFGTSTKIIIYNATKDPLEFFECGSTSGQWSVMWDEQKKAYHYQIPPDIIEPEQCVNLLHVKKNWTLSGSIGHAGFLNRKTCEKIYIGWSSPLLAPNSLGIKTVEKNFYLKDYEKLGEQESDEQTADEDGFKMKGYAKILNNDTTPLILFVFHE